SSTAASPTPPPAPRTTSVSPGWTAATDRRTWYAVRCATPNAAAVRSSTPSGMRVSAVGATTISSAKAPASAVPATRCPTATPVTPSATSSTMPANSRPGTNGAGTLIWYSSATRSTSGKFTAAACTCTRTCPAPSSGAGSSATDTFSGGPCSRQTTARTSANRVVRGLGELGGALHEVEHDGAEGEELLVVARALEALLEHDGELPLGEDDVVVDVVGLASGHLGVVGEQLVPGRHPVEVDVAGTRRVGRAGVVRPALHHPGEVELGIADGAHLPVDDGGELRG